MISLDPLWLPPSQAAFKKLPVLFQCSQPIQRGVSWTLSTEVKSSVVQYIANWKWLEWGWGGNQLKLLWVNLLHFLNISSQDFIRNSVLGLDDYKLSFRNLFCLPSCWRFPKMGLSISRTLETEKHDPCEVTSLSVEHPHFKSREILPWESQKVNSNYDDWEIHLAFAVFVPKLLQK